MSLRVPSSSATALSMTLSHGIVCFVLSQTLVTYQYPDPSEDK